MQTKDKLQDATHDLRFLLDHGYKKKGALTFVANRYLLDKRQRNFLARSVFSKAKSEERKRKIIKIAEIKNKHLFVDGYNVLISVESICANDRESIVLCDDGVLRDLNAVFGKYKFSNMTKNALNQIISIIKDHDPSNVTFFFDRQVSFSAKLANLTQEIMSEYKLEGDVNLSKIVDFELTKAANDIEGIVATSDSVMIDKVRKIVDIPFYILNDR
ncbi:MAG: DUF434 domain-containing protein [Euryarchaeota archaeon]|nr:DUF434 domain-containing protein [Euryarchaeota archaeon]